MQMGYPIKFLVAEYLANLDSRRSVWERLPPGQNLAFSSAKTNTDPTPLLTWHRELAVEPKARAVMWMLPFLAALALAMGFAGPSVFYVLIGLGLVVLVAYLFAVRPHEFHHFVLNSEAGIAHTLSVQGKPQGDRMASFLQSRVPAAS